MYIEIIIPIIAVIGVKKYIDYNKTELIDDDFEYVYNENDSCPTIMFDKNGNHYYVYE